LILIGFSKTALAAPTPIGQVVWVKGKVTATSPGEPSRTLQRRSPIFEKDVLVTDTTSTGQIVFTDNSLVALKEDTKIEIEQYKFGKGVPAEKSTFVANVAKGGFRTITGIIPKNNAQNYRVKTPVATIGVSGTEYSFLYKGQLWVQYVSGKPCISNGGGQQCLSAKKPYGNVENAQSAPTIVKQLPASFASPEITPASFNPTATDTAVTPTGNPGSTGGTSGGTGVIDEGGGTGSSGSVNEPVASFCIG
jgi:hypothetical protein